MARIHEPLTVDTQTNGTCYVEEMLEEDDVVQVWSQTRGEWRDCTVANTDMVRLPGDWTPAPEAGKTATLPHRLVRRQTDCEPDTAPGEQVDLRTEYIDVERQIAEMEAAGEEPERWLLVRRSCIRKKLIDEGHDLPEIGKLFDDDGQAWFDVAIERTRQAQKLREAYHDAKREVRELREKLDEKAAE